MKKILLLIIISLVFSTNVYAKKAKGGAGKGGFSAKSAPAQKPSLLQSAMPALVGGAVGSYVGSKLASDGEIDSAAAEAEKKEDHPLTTR